MAKWRSNTDNEWPDEEADFTKPGVRDLPEHYEVNTWWRCCCFATKEEADDLAAQWSLEKQPKHQNSRQAAKVVLFRNGAPVQCWYWERGKCWDFGVYQSESVPTPSNPGARH